MPQIRYGAREVVTESPEIETTRAPIWSQALTAIYETDPDAIAAVLPKPLEPPDEPLVRVTITSVEMPGLPVFGAGYFAVRARHAGTDGEYPLVMPMTTEQAVIGGRETFGEPKKLGEVVATRDGDDVRGLMARLGTTFVEVRGRVVETLPVPPERTKTDFYFKFLMNPDGTGFDHDPALVYCYKKEVHRLLERVEGEITLRESSYDPVVDLPVRAVRDINWSERSTQQWAEIREFVPSDWVLAFAHQRYDNLSPIGAKK